MVENLNVLNEDNKLSRPRPMSFKVGAKVPVNPQMAAQLVEQAVKITENSENKPNPLQTKPTPK